jgi:hypothetical protein
MNKLVNSYVFYSILFFIFLIPFSQESQFFKDTKLRHFIPIKINLLQNSGKLLGLLECDLSKRWVNYATNYLKCNNEDVRTDTEFIIKSSNSIDYNNAITMDPSGEEVTVHLKSVSISHARPMKIAGSGTVKIILSGTNSFTAIKNSDENNNNYNYNPGLACYSIYIAIIIDKEADADNDYSGILILQGAGTNPGLGSVNDYGCNSIHIKGGYVEATGGNSDQQEINGKQFNPAGAGIGTGSGGNINQILISGGVVIANGGATDGAGIGTGSYGYINKIDISGGTIIAYGGRFGAGIGAGAGRAYGSSKIYDIFIRSPAVVRAYIPNDNQAGGAAIGGGLGACEQSSQVHYIGIKGGTILAQNYDGHGAGIGGGFGDNIPDAAIVETIDIEGGTIVVFSSYKSHGIGCGEGNSHQSDNSGRVYTLNFKGLDRLYAEGKARNVLGQGETANQRYVGSQNYQNNLDNLIQCLDDKRICWYPDRINPLDESSPAPLTDLTPICDISKGNIIKTDWYIKCNGSPAKMMTSTCIVIGHTTTYQMDLNLNNPLAFYFRDVEIQSSKPLYAYGSGTLYIYFLNNNIFESNENPAIYINSKYVSVVFNEETRDDANQLHAIVDAGAFPGIGTAHDLNDIIIESGYIEAIGSDGLYGDHANVDGQKPFSSSGAGIGSATYGTIANIKITGGTVYAQGGTYATGIGTGTFGEITNIIITGGTVTSFGGKYGAGIGTGYGDRDKSGDYKVAKVNLIHISGGIVHAYAIEEEAHGAGIGAGSGRGTYSSTVNTIKISGGTVRAEVSSDGYGAAIGSGYGYAIESSYVGTIELIGGDITAIGPYNAAGIGYGYGYYKSITPSATDDSSNVGQLIISDDVEKLYASSYHVDGSLGQSPNENERQIITTSIDDAFLENLYCYPDNTVCQYPDPFPTPTPEPTQSPWPTPSQSPWPTQTQSPTPTTSQ